MPFWRKSDDPWDVDPARERAKREREPAENLLHALREWSEKRRSEIRAKKAAEAAVPPEKCPWCGGDMERGVLTGGKGVYWYPGRRPSGVAFWLGGGAVEEALRVDDEGTFNGYKTAWYCRTCGRMAFSIQPPQTPEFDQQLEEYTRRAREGTEKEAGEAPEETV